MKQSNWKDIVELIGIAAIVASLVFVGMQMKQSQQLAFAESILAMAANEFEEGSIQIEHLDIWLKGNAGDDLNAREREIYRILIKNRQARSLSTWVALKSIGTQNEGVATQGMARFLNQNPGARAEWMLRTQQTETSRPIEVGSFPAFAALVEADLKQLDEKSNRD